MLLAQFGGDYLPSPWVRFTDAAGSHWCQPDGVLTLPQGKVIVEVKYQHTTEAWYQLRLLYEPVLRCLYPDTPLSVIEVVKWYDCAIVFPEPARLIKNLALHQGGEFGVHIWKP